MDTNKADAYNDGRCARGEIHPSDLTELTYAFQTGHGLVPDGMCGPATLSVLAQVRRARAMDDWPGFPALVERWRPAIEAELARITYDTGVRGPDGKTTGDSYKHGPIDEHEVNFLLKWIEVESGGRPEATGLIRADGFKTEAGLGQLYFEGPTDVQFGATSGELYAPDATPGNPGKQISSLVAMERAYRIRARKSTRSPMAWSTADHYRLTKLVHALPALLDLQSAAVHTFAQLRTGAMSLTRDKLPAALRPFHGRPMANCFNNAERTASVVS